MNIMACVQNNGHFSSPFNVERGVRQCAPNSSYIFLLCAEIMAIMLHENKQIQGIPVGDTTHMLGQYVTCGLGGYQFLLEYVLENVLNSRRTEHSRVCLFLVTKAIT